MEIKDQIKLESENPYDLIETIEIKDGVTWLRYIRLIEPLQKKLNLILEVIKKNKEQFLKQPERLDALDSILKNDNKEQVTKDDKKNHDSHKKKQKNINKERKLQEEHYNKLYEEYKNYGSTVTGSRFKGIISKYIKHPECGMTHTKQRAFMKNLVYKINAKDITEGLKEADAKIKNDTKILANEVDHKPNEINELVNKIEENESFKTKANNNSNCNLFKKLIENSKFHLDKEKISLLKLLDCDSLTNTQSAIFKLVNSRIMYNGRYNSRLLIQKFLNNMQLIQGFLDIQESDYDNTVISNELIEAFVSEFVKETQQFMDDRLRDGNITSDNDVKSLKKDIVRLIDKIEAINEDLVNEKLSSLLKVIPRINEVLKQFKTQVSIRSSVYSKKPNTARELENKAYVILRDALSKMSKKKAYKVLRNKAPNALRNKAPRVLKNKVSKVLKSEESEEWESEASEEL